MAGSRFKTTNDIYFYDQAWSRDDLYAVFRFLTHAFGRCGRSKPYAREVARLRFEDMAPEILAIAKCVLQECPDGKLYLTQASRDAIESALPLDPPIHLIKGSHMSSTPEPYQSMGVLLHEE